MKAPTGVKVVKRLPTGNDTVLMCGRWNCLEPMNLPDNLIGKCDECGHAVQYRPHAPKKIRKICMQCVATFTDGEPELITTQRMLDDAETFYKRQKQ